MSVITVACEDALHLRVSCVVLQCCDRPDLEKHRDRELRLSAWWQKEGESKSWCSASLSQAAVSLCQ